MNNRIVLKNPINVVYEGRILNVTVKVYEICLLRSGKPCKVYGKDLINPQKQLAPYDYEYLDWESKEKIEAIIKAEKKKVKTFGELKKGDYVYRMVTATLDGIPVVRKETVEKIEHTKYNSVFYTDMSGDCIVNNNQTIYSSSVNTVSTNEEEVKPLYIKALNKIINEKRDKIKTCEKIIEKCTERLNDLKY